MVMTTKHPSYTLPVPVCQAHHLKGPLVLHMGGGISGPVPSSRAPGRAEKLSPGLYGWLTGWLILRGGTGRRKQIGGGELFLPGSAEESKKGREGQGRGLDAASRLRLSDGRAGGGDCTQRHDTRRPLFLHCIMYLLARRNQCLARLLLQNTKCSMRSYREAGSGDEPFCRPNVISPSSREWLVRLVARR